MKDNNTSNDATMQDKPVSSLVRTHEEMLKFYPHADKENISVIDGNAYTWKESEQVWRFDLTAQAKLLIAHGPIEIPPGDLDAMPELDNTIRNLGCFNSTAALKTLHPNPKRGDGCFIGTSVAFWDAYWNNWQDGGPLPKSVTKDVADLSEVDLGTLFQFVGENYTPTYVGPTGGIHIIGSYGSEADMRRVHPTGEEDQGVIVAHRGLFVWDIEKKDWIFQADLTGPTWMETPTQLEQRSSHAKLVDPAVNIPVTSILFQEIGNPARRVIVIGDFHTGAIADAHAPKVGTPGQAYVADGQVYVWSDEVCGWVNEGRYGVYWTVVKPATAPGMEHSFRSEPIFKNDTIAPPPRPGSNADLEQQERQRQWELRQQHEKDLLIDSKEHPSLNDVASLLESALGQLEGEESDAAFKALDALKKVRKDLKRKRLQRIFMWFIAMLVLGGVGYWLYKWIPTQVVTGRYTVPKNCSVPFGKGEITGQRFYDYQYKSLFGIHMTLESTVAERTVVNVGGQEVTIFGLAPKLDVPEPEEVPVADQVLKAAEVEVVTAPKPPKGKWWRLNILPGDKGTMNMKPAELYLFFSEKDTAMVSYKTFCSANKEE